MLSALPSLAPVDARSASVGRRPGLLRRTLAVLRATTEVFAEAKELRRTLGRRYPFADF
jgi:hypothetical protein